MEKAPNKIYILPSQHNLQYDNGGEEYICKDTLLEWLNKQLVASAESLRFERNKAFADVIDKINSL